MYNLFELLMFEKPPGFDMLIDDTNFKHRVKFLEMLQKIPIDLSSPEIVIKARNTCISVVFRRSSLQSLTKPKQNCEE